MQCGKQAAWKKKKGNKTFYFCEECAKATYQLQEGLMLLLKERSDVVVKREVQQRVTYLKQRCACATCKYWREDQRRASYMSSSWDKDSEDHNQVFEDWEDVKMEWIECP